MPADSAKVHPPGDGHRALLLVEDDASLRGEFTALLQEAGWQVRTHEDPDAALAAAESVEGGLPDVAVVDLRAGGGAAPLVLRLRTRRPDLPVVLLSADKADADGEQLRRAGLGIRLSPPLDLAALAAVCARLATLPPEGAETPGPLLVPYTAALAAPQPGAAERRREQRFELSHPRPLRVRLAPGADWRWAVVRDVTSRGLRLELGGQELEGGKGALVRLELEEAGSHAVLHAQGVVRWVSRPGAAWSVGVEFDDPQRRAARRMVYDLLVSD